MASRFYYFFSFIGSLMIAFGAIFGSHLVFKQQNYIAGYSMFGITLLVIILFIGSLNTINRRIASFFNSVHNQDTSILLPKKSNSKAINDIYDGMNKMVDVFQSVKMESEIREKLFMAMIEHSTTGFISIDEHGDFEIMNQMARKLMGVEYTSNIDRMKTDTPELYEAINYLAPGQSKSCRIIRPDFSTIIQVSLSKLNYKDKKLTLVSLLDIQKEIDARELESWQKLIRIMNHEIMNSIAPITSASKSLMKIFIKDEKTIEKEDISDKNIVDTRNCLEIIDTMSSGLIYFVENYRRLSKIPEPVLKKIAIQKWGETLKRVLPEFVQSNTELEIDIDKNLKHFMGDENLLNQVIINLVRNASDAPLLNDKKVIKVTLEPPIKGNLNLKVWNNGAPIDNENIDKIFIPFFTTKQEGAGIGLYVSKQIINLHNGSLTVASSSKAGTRFTISI